MLPDRTYVIKSNSRCQFRVYVSAFLDPNGNKYRLPIMANYSTNITFFTKATAYTSTTFNYQMLEFNARFISIQNGTYVTIINRDNIDQNFTTKFIDAPQTPDSPIYLLPTSPPPPSISPPTPTPPPIVITPPIVTPPPPSVPTT